MNIEPVDFMFPIAGGYIGLIIAVWLMAGFGNTFSLNFYCGIILLGMLIGIIFRYIQVKFSKGEQNE